MAAEQAEADGHGHQRHREGGQQLENEGREERHLQGGHGRRAVAFGDVPDRGDLGLGPTEDLEGGEAGHHVEEVAGQALEQAGLPLASEPSSRRRPSAMNSGISGTVTAMIRAEIQSAPATTTMTVTGTITARNSWGR